MILIADSGSTTTNWITIRPKDEDIIFKTEGYNPFFVDKNYINKSLESQIPDKLKKEEVSEVHFYGAGCIGDRKLVIKEAMQGIFCNAKIDVNNDILGAARSLLGTNRGFVAILGTGTNSCLFDGKGISYQIDSLGYILGDEGSGCAIGKKLLRDYVRGRMPDFIKEDFLLKYKLGPEEIINRIYNEPLANRFCASFTKFLVLENIHGKYTYNLLKESFSEFFRNIVIQYPRYEECKFNCVGSVGFYFKKILEEVCLEFNMRPGKIIQSPIGGLKKYHIQN